MNRRVWGVLLILLMICLSCSEVKEYVNIAKDEHISKEYIAALDTWTRDKTVYAQFETRVRIAATYKSTEFKDAYLTEFSRVYLLTDSEIKVRRAGLVEVASDFEEFLFYAYIPEKDANDFAKPRSIWKVFLVDSEGKRYYPIELRHIEKITPVIEEFFPYVKRHYGKFYSVKFAPFDTPGKLNLIFTSTAGKVELTWDNNG